MNILVTGADGFIGKNLVMALAEKGHNVLKYARNSSNLEEQLDQADFVYHIAGVNRSTQTDDFTKSNVNLTKKILDYLEKSKKCIPILFSSTIHIDSNTIYGNTKKEAEDLFYEYQKRTQCPMTIYRLYGVFGRWAKPNYNNVVATFIHQAINGESFSIHDKDSILKVHYIDEVIDGFLSELIADKLISNPKYIKPIHQIKIGELAQTISEYKSLYEQQTIPDIQSDFDKYLYATFISYYDLNALNTSFARHDDDRGSFIEILKNNISGQLSLNVINPGVVKGNHYHHTKHERFLTVQGKTIIKIRHLYDNKISVYESSSDDFRWITIPPGTVHSIENNSDQTALVLMWANEIFNKNQPDTYTQKV